MYKSNNKKKQLSTWDDTDMDDSGQMQNELINQDNLDRRDFTQNLSNYPNKTPFGISNVSKSMNDQMVNPSKLNTPVMMNQNLSIQQRAKQAINDKLENDRRRLAEESEERRQNRHGGFFGKLRRLLAIADNPSDPEEYNRIKDEKMKRKLEAMGIYDKDDDDEGIYYK